MPVVFCFDKNYAPYAAVATASLLKTNPYPFPIYWIVGAADAETAHRFRERIRAPHNPITVISVDDAIFAGWRGGDHISRAAYIRLTIPAVLKERRALYLDCDVLVTSDIRPLLALDLGGNWFAGVIDLFLSGAPGTRPPFPKICSDHYLNSGVLLMNLEALRNAKFLRLALETYQQHYRRIYAHDQCLINLCAEGRKTTLDARWNWQVRPLQTTEAQWRALTTSGDAAILHFLDAVKPWQKWCPPWISRSWKAAADEIGLEDRYYETSLTIPKAIVLASAMHRAQQFEKASALRSEIIKTLMAKQSKADAAALPLGAQAQ